MMASVSKLYFGRSAIHNGANWWTFRLTNPDNLTVTVDVAGETGIPFNGVGLDGDWWWDEFETFGRRPTKVTVGSQELSFDNEVIDVAHVRIGEVRAADFDFELTNTEFDFPVGSFKLFMINPRTTNSPVEISRGSRSDVNFTVGKEEIPDFDSQCGVFVEWTIDALHKMRGVALPKKIC